MRLPARVAPAATAVRRVRAVVRPPRQAAVFDAALYLRENPDVAAVAARDPLRHYLSHGWREGRRPNVWFDPAAYIAAYPDVAAQDVDPLLHYVLHGKQEGRSAGVGGTVPDAAPPVEQRGDRTSGLSVEDRVRPYFDADFYAAANPDVAASGVDPFGHFLRSGWAEGRNPSRTFDVGHYLADNPDVSAAGLNPLVHYATSGVEEGRQLRPPLSPAQRQLRAAVPPRTRALAWAGGADLSPALSRDELAEALSDLVGTADDVVM